MGNITNCDEYLATVYKECCVENCDAIAVGAGQKCAFSLWTLLGLLRWHRRPSADWSCLCKTRQRWSVPNGGEHGLNINLIWEATALGESTVIVWQFYFWAAGTATATGHGCFFIYWSRTRRHFHWLKSVSTHAARLWLICAPCELLDCNRIMRSLFLWKRLRILMEQASTGTYFLIVLLARGHFAALLARFWRQLGIKINMSVFLKLERPWLRVAGRLN